LYEYYRGSGLSTETFEDKASGNPKSNFVRNLFGGSAGGRILRDRTFFFGSLEGLRVRSSANNNWFVPTQEFVANAAPNMQEYLTAFGGLPSTPGALCMTAAEVQNQFDGTPVVDYGTPDPNDPSRIRGLFRSGTTQLIPASTPLFCRTATHVPIDAGGGTAQDTWSVVGRIDHRFSQNTALMGRYAYYDQKFPVGAGSDSPFTQFQTPATFRSQNITLTLTHGFSPTLFNESRFVYSRTFPNSPLGEAPFTAPCFSTGATRQRLPAIRSSFLVTCRISAAPFPSPAAGRRTPIRLTPASPCRAGNTP
jgi:hypothetical protein